MAFPEWSERLPLPRKPVRAGGRRRGWTFPGDFAGGSVRVSKRGAVSRSRVGRGSVRRAACAALALPPLLLSGCSSVKQVRNLVLGQPSPYLRGYIGSVSADEPVAALTGRDVLARGGNAADAAAAVGFSLAATLPSRASLGGGGACLGLKADAKQPEAFLFLPTPGSAPVAGGRPGSTPTMARGLFLLQARQGSVAFGDVVRPAARLAAGGTAVSRALAADLSAVGRPLLADPAAAAIFGRDGAPLAAGDQLVQKDLGLTLSRIALAGAGDLYTGSLAQYYLSGADAAGAGLTADDLRDATPAEGAPLTVQADRDSVFFLPPPADGGLGAAAAFRQIENGGSGAGVADGIVAAWRAAHPPGGANSDAALAEAQAAVDGAVAGGGGLPRLPASTAFTVVDRAGGAVACALTENNLFGTGRIAGETGVVIGASPSRVPPPLLAAAIATRNGLGFRAAVAASGQNDAAQAVAQAMANALAERPVAPVTDTGRVEAIACPRGSTAGSTCEGTSDARGAGLATRSD
ncbi:MAG: gamma-glutamyltransferase [Gluconacetobacter diazotrophicus]|nr:gamma-glutamyltransferase [Gluconacetobacter diazotrophicus]